MIEECAKRCAACQANKNLPAKAQLHPCTSPNQPWERIHIDFARPVMGKMLLVVVDAQPEISVTTSTTSAKTITVLQEMFAHYVIPRTVVSDNGPQFGSEEFQQFMGLNGVKHICTSPYHPASNGAAERLVQTVKQALRAGQQTRSPLEKTLAAFLLRYRTTPHSTTGVPPSELLFGRNIRTRLDMLRPDVGGRVRDKQSQQKEYHDQHSTTRVFHIGDTVWVWNLRDGPRWVPGVVSDQLGPLSYMVQVSDGNLWRRHVDHIRRGTEQHDDSTTVENPQ